MTNCTDTEYGYWNSLPLPFLEEGSLLSAKTYRAASYLGMGFLALRVVGPNE